MKTYKSKTNPNIVYESHKVGNKRYLRILYKEKILYRGNSYPVKVMSVKFQLESWFYRYRDVLLAQYEQREIDVEAANAIYKKIHAVYHENRN